MNEWDNMYQANYAPEAGHAGEDGGAYASPRGSECPFTLEMLELALGLAPPEEERRLRGHAEGCERCRERLRYQERAARQTRPSAVGTDESVRPQTEDAFRGLLPYHWSGHVAPLRDQAADGAEAPTVAQVATLGVRDVPGIAPVRVILSWRRLAALTREGKGTSAPWELTLRVPSLDADPECGNSAEHLEWLNGCEVMLVLRTSENRHVPLHGTRLEWSSTRREVVSHPEVVPTMADPHTVTRIDFFRGKTLEAYDT